MASESASAYRARVQRWLADHAADLQTVDTDAAGPGIARAKAVQAALYDGGFAGITWPTAYGGQGLSNAQQAIFDEEVKNYDIADRALAVGLGMCGPTILQLGSAAQKERYLPSLLRGDEVWCQLFSEPGAGSDVASLQATAVRVDTGWLLNGQKVWTSGAHESDFGIAIARTDPTVAKHAGITMFIVDLRLPGITVRELKVATGESPFCEVFFDDVVLPLDAVVGELNAGWAAAIVMLKNERISIGSRTRSRVAPLSFDALAAVARARGRDGDAAVRRTLVHLYVGERALDLFVQRIQEQAAAGGQDVGAFGSIAKLAGVRVDQLGAQAATEVLGTQLASFAPGSPESRAAHEMVAQLRFAIGGGTNQIQLNIIAERLLGLPKDPGGDRTIPFNQLRVGTMHL